MGLKEQWRDLRFKVWTWWRASSVTPDPAYMDRQAQLAKILWLQEQLDAALAEVDRLKTRLARDDYLLGRPASWEEKEV